MLYIDEDQNISLTRGDTGIFHIILQNKNGKAYTPQSGDSLRFALGKSWGKDTIFTKQIPLDTCILEIEPADTKSLDFKKYKYDIEFTDAAGHVSTILLGEFTVDKEVY
jgi:hypothetical protein